MWDPLTRWRGAALIISVALALPVGVPAVGTAETIVDSGTLFFGEPKPQNCDSPIGNCSRSRLNGAVKRYKFTAQTAGPADDDPNSVVLRGNSVIKMRGGGRLFTEDTVRVNQTTGDLVHLWVITGGAGRYAGAKGAMAGGGNVANLGSGVPYNATITVPDD